MSTKDVVGAEEINWRPPKNNRWTESDGQSVVHALRNSGLNRNAFARTHGIPVHRVSYWDQRISLAPKSRSVAAEPAFVPLSLEPAPPYRAIDQTVKLDFRGLWQIELPLDVPERELRKLIRCLGEVTS